VYQVQEQPESQVTEAVGRFPHGSRAAGSDPPKRYARNVGLLLLALLCAWSPLSSFGDKMILHPPAARAAALAEVMQERLSLTPDQAAAVRAAAEQRAEETDAARGKYTRRKLKKQLKAIGAARDTDFRSILTTEQFTAYENDKRAILKAMQARMKGTDPDRTESTASAQHP
jgi:hypothetical protein